MAKSELAREKHPEISASDVSDLVAGNTGFAVDAYRALAAKSAGANLLLSPYSMSIALAMAFAGAGGQTASEMATTMHWTLPTTRFHRAFDALDEELGSREQDGLTLRFADSIWASPAVRFEKPFLDTMARSYGTGVRLVDPGDPEGSQRRMNDWVADATKGHIQELFARGTSPVGDSLVVLNAVYFHADWAEPFKATNTLSEDFWRPDGSRTSAQMMHNGLRTRCAKNSDYDAVELTYAGRQVAMDIVMPKAPLSSFESALTGEKLGEILRRMYGATVILSMPRFRFAGPPFSLSDLLQGLGMRSAFDRQHADFSPMGTAPGGPLYVSDVLHQATILVNEKGTEATAVTAIRMGTTAARPDEPVEIRIDHPFFFVLRDLPTDTILFAGRVVDPGRDAPSN
jgi:serpin B